jgi:hypothetical protein
MSSGKSSIQRVIWPPIFTPGLLKNIPNFLGDTLLKRLEFIPFMGKFAFARQICLYKIRASTFLE